jgi:hypothetical protein
VLNDERVHNFSSLAAVSGNLSVAPRQAATMAMATRRDSQRDGQELCMLCGVLSPRIRSAGSVRPQMRSARSSVAPLIGVPDP